MMSKLRKAREAKAEIENPHESDRLRAIAEILATVESEQRGAAIDQREACSIDPDDGRERIKKEERTTEILDILDGYGPGGPSLAEIWFAQCAPADLETSNPEALSHYSQMSLDEWDEQVERWAATMRGQGEDDVKHFSDRELAGAHVLDKWGVSLERFEAVVVEFDTVGALTDLLAGPSEETESAVRANTNAIAEADSSE